MKKKTKLKKDLNYIRNTIEEYINNGDNYPRIDILDGDSRPCIEGYDEYNENGYSGVTAKYIRKYLFDNKYSKALIHTALLKLMNAGIITTIYCPDIKSVVWETEEGVNGGDYHLALDVVSYEEFQDLCVNGDEDSEGHSNLYYKNAYKNIIRSYKGVTSYLNI